MGIHHLGWRTLTIFAVEFVGFADVDLDVGAVELVEAVAALGDSVTNGGRWQTLVVDLAVEVLGGVADVLAVDFVGAVATVVVAVADKVQRDAHLAGARELVQAALLTGAAFVLVRCII